MIWVNRSAKRWKKYEKGDKRGEWVNGFQHPVNGTGLSRTKRGGRNVNAVSRHMHWPWRCCGMNWFMLMGLSSSVMYSCRPITITANLYCRQTHSIHMFTSTKPECLMTVERFRRYHSDNIGHTDRKTDGQWFQNPPPPPPSFPRGV